MTPLKFEVPAAFADSAIYERFGAIIRERATGKIAGHLQELGGWDLLRHLPIPGGNPLGLATEAIQMGQLHHIQQTLNTVQTLATVGAVASVASLGVSVAGFAAVLMKLDRMEGTLDRVLAHTAQVRELAEGLHVKTDALAMATLRARLEAVSMAQHYDETRRRTSLADAIEKLAELRHYYGALLASPKFCEGTENLFALLDTQERLVAACEGELFAEFLLGANAQAITERWRHQTAVFDAIAWRTPQSLYRLAEQADRDFGVFMVTQAEVRQARVMMLADVRKESTARLASLPAIATFLQERGVTVEDYIRSIAEQASTGAPLVVVDRRSESASLQPEG